MERHLIFEILLELAAPGERAQPKAQAIEPLGH
jgi:hypothetical protein